MSCIITYFQHPQFHGWSPNIDVGHRLDPHIVYVTGNPDFKNTYFFLTKLTWLGTPVIRFFIIRSLLKQISMFLLSFFPQHFKMKVRRRKKKIPGGGGRGGYCSPSPSPQSLPPHSKKQTGKTKLLKGCVITTVIFPKTCYWLLSI